MLSATAYVLGPVLGAALGARDEKERLFTSTRSDLSPGAGLLPVRPLAAPFFRGAASRP
jgi:hypothetical protein